METFSFFITQSVIDHMGLSNDGQTVSKWVRISDLFADGTLSVSDYHALASAGVVVTKKDLFTFESVEETAQGWNCIQIEPEPRAWWHTLGYLRKLFPGGRQWQLWLPEPPPWGYYLTRCKVKREQIERFEPYETYTRRGVTYKRFLFSEGTVTLNDKDKTQWVEMYLMRELDLSYSYASFFEEENQFSFSENDLLRYYE